MTYRERIVRTVQFEPVDQLPLRHAYGLMPGVLDEWHQQGLPESIATEDDVRLHFGFLPRSPGLPITTGPIPAFEARIISESDEERIAIDRWGRTTRLLKRVTTLPLATEFPVSDRASWEPYRERLVFSEARIGADLESAAERLRNAGHLISIGVQGFYWFPRDLLGDEGLCIAYYEQPDLILSMNETWCELLERVLRAVLERIDLDAVQLAEDMAYRNGSMIGPDIFDRFMRPYYERIHSIVDRYRIPVFSVDTDGRTDDLMRWFSSCGVNMIGPNEVQAGNDIVAYRGELGRTMAFDGGFDKRVLREGPEAIDAMLERTIPPIRESGGGWLMCLDHRVLPGTPLHSFERYVSRARELATYP